MYPYEKFSRYQYPIFNAIMADNQYLTILHKHNNTDTTQSTIPIPKIETQSSKLLVQIYLLQRYQNAKKWQTSADTDVDANISCIPIFNS